MQERVNDNRTIEEMTRRLEALEAEVAELKKQLLEGRPAKDWRRTVGRFKDDPTYDEALQLGREWRHSDPKC